MPIGVYRMGLRPGRFLCVNLQTRWASGFAETFVFVKSKWVQEDIFKNVVSVVATAAAVAAAAAMAAAAAVAAARLRCARFSKKAPRVHHLTKN